MLDQEEQLYKDIADLREENARLKRQLVVIREEWGLHLCPECNIATIPKTEKVCGVCLTRESRERVWNAVNDGTYPF